MIRYIRSKHREHTRFYFLFALLILLLVARYGLQIAIPRFVLTGTIAVCALLSCREEILCLALCCIPWCEAIDLSYALLACTGSYLLKYHKEIRINLSVIVVLCMIVWELLHCFEPGFSLIGFLFSIITLLFLMMVLCIRLRELDYGFLVRTMSIATATMCVALLTNLFVQANFNVASAVAGLQRLGLVSDNSAVVGTAINPNSLGIICVLSVTGLFQLRLIGGNKKTDILLTVVLLIFGAMTASRTFLVCLCAMAILLIAGDSADIRNKLRFSALIFVIAIAALLILYWLFPDLLEYYVNRFKNGEISSGRSELNEIYHSYIVNHPNVMFLGIGRNNFTIKLTEIYRIAVNTPHNSIQEIIVAWGIPGLMMFAVLFGMLIFRSRKINKSQTLLNYIPLIIIVLKSMVGQLLTSHYTMLALSYAYLSLCQEFKPQSK